MRPLTLALLVSIAAPHVARASGDAHDAVASAAFATATDGLRARLA